MKNTILLIFLITLAASCAKDSDLATDKANFTRIYDNNKFDASNYPIDMKQTPDGGYLILGRRKLTDSNFSGTYLMKVDEWGAFVSELEVPSDKVAPIGPLLEVNGKYYFFTMTPIGLKTELNEVDSNGALTKTISVTGDGAGGYPAAAYNDNGRFLLLRYDNVDKESVVDVITPAGATSSYIGFSVGRGDNVEAPIIEHFLQTGRQFPFQIGKTTAGQYFFNGFYNYTFSLVFTDLVSDTPGVVQGQQDDGGFSALMPLDGNRYSAARFNFGDNYLLPTVTLNSTGISSSADLNGNNLPELSSNATVKIISATVNGKDISLYGSNTRSKQISLYGYEKATGKFLGSRYLGFSNPFEIAAVTTTKDGGLAVCGTTYVAGRFPRICLFKISREELAKSFK
ncbi:MAG: hypothetical protein HYZ44_01305 [Bacteroidetes bacterium]|nr:hypothetical protein [Bacteroidota bacterium]